MQIQSDNPQLLDEIYNDFQRKNIEAKKVTKTVEGAMGDITSYIELAINIAPLYATTLLTYFSYRLSQKKNFIHFKYKNGLEVKFDNLSKEEFDKKEKYLREDIFNNKLEFIYFG
jgi:hypothetical protein